MFFAELFINVVFLCFSGTPKSPTVFPLMECGSGTGSTVTLGCLATDFTPSSLTYSWSKSGTALTDFIQYPPTMKDNFYTGVSQISVKRQDWDNRGSEFKCVAAHSTGNVEATFTKPSKKLFIFLSYKSNVVDICIIQISNIKYLYYFSDINVVTPKPNVTVYFPPEEVIRGANEVTLVCLVTGPQPLKNYTIFWSESENQQNSKTKMQYEGVCLSKHDSGTSFMVTSIYKTTKEKWKINTMFGCTFQSDGISNSKMVSQAQGKSCEHPTDY